MKWVKVIVVVVAVMAAGNLLIHLGAPDWLRCVCASFGYCSIIFQLRNALEGTDYEHWL